MCMLLFFVFSTTCQIVTMKIVWKEWKQNNKLVWIGMKVTK